MFENFGFCAVVVRKNNQGRPGSRLLRAEQRIPGFVESTDKMLNAFADDAMDWRHRYRTNN